MIITRGVDNGMRHHYVPCECKSMEHMFCFVYFEDAKKHIDPHWSDELYLEVQMISNKEWYKRVWAAIKYVFGHTSNYGHWDSASISPEEAVRMVELLNRFINAHSVKPETVTPKNEITEDQEDGC